MTPETRQARGYAVNICILLKNIPDLELGDSKEFLPLKILTAKTVGRYIAMNDKIAVDSVEGLAGKSRVKKTHVKRAASKKRPAVAIEVQLDTDVGRPVVQKTDEIEHWFDLSYEEFTTRQANKIVESASEANEEHETVAYETGVGEQQLQTFVEQEVATEIEMETVSADPVITKSDDILVEVDESPAATTAKDIDLATVTDVVQSSSDEELLSIDDLLKRIPGDMMLPSVLAGELIGHGISIPGVADGDLYKASLPKIALTDKGKAPLSRPAYLRRLAFLTSLNRDIAANEENVLTWAETDSVQVALQRKVYLLAKYREMLLRNFLESQEQILVQDNLGRTKGWLSTVLEAAVRVCVVFGRFSWAGWSGPDKSGRIEHVGPLDSLDFNGAGDPAVDFIPTEGELRIRAQPGACWDGTIVSTVANRKMVVTNDVFTEMFQLPTEGLVSFSELPAKAVAEMKAVFSGTGVPFKPSNKKKDMKVEYRLVQDNMAKSLCAKADSFDVVTSEKFYMMVAISAGLKQAISGVRSAVEYSVGEAGESRPWESVALHPLKVLNNKYVLTYMKKNQVVAQAGESSKASGDTDSENKFTTDDLQSQTKRLKKEMLDKRKENDVEQRKRRLWRKSRRRLLDLYHGFSAGRGVDPADNAPGGG
ncbi:dnaJsubfamily B member 11-like [Dorcoceras hygrometricum]|uniref:DnaJsubfamily B member 11-like n=1 Tax=Dorcoceras hygrometricum TaxID=472368 RepID=A0A2Z7C698_9LAMI|nr:dnaJsubfamily B member 11-like [Dorcoceras hygrometricum]